MEIKRYSKNLHTIFDSHAEIYIHSYKTKELLATIKVDLDKVEEAIKYKWCLTGDEKYARNRELGLMHRWIVGAHEDNLVDHRDEDGFNNTVRNLREANKSLNGYNVSKAKSNNKFGLRGVTERRGKYRACIKVDGKQTWLGDFKTPEEASEAYEVKRKEMIEKCAQNTEQSSAISICTLSSLH